MFQSKQLIALLSTIAVSGAMMTAPVFAEEVAATPMTDATVSFDTELNTTSDDGQRGFFFTIATGDNVDGFTTYEIGEDGNLYDQDGNLVATIKSHINDIPPLEMGEGGEVEITVRTSNSCSLDSE